MTAEALPPLRAALAQQGLTPKKSLGQNFLLDLNLTAKIARLAAPLHNCAVIEIGPGPGGLTRALLEQGAYVTAIERDARCLPLLEQIAQYYPGRLRIIHADALTCDFAALAAESHFGGAAQGKPKIIANLPYNIGTELLLRWLSAEPWPPFYHSMTLMFQKEVAARISAPPGSGAYGRLSVLAQWRCAAETVMTLPPQAFTPPPKVHSAVVRLTPRAAPMPCDAAVLAQVTQAAFGQRRKMLRQSLKQLSLTGKTAQDLLAQTGIAPTERAENLSIAEFVALANAAALPA